jgi:RNA polymerase sigma-32 factor
MIIKKAEQERALIIAAQAGDRAALNKLYASSHRWIAKVAHKFSTYGAPVEDLIQAGAEGWTYALRRFDPDRGVRLLTYANHWIRVYMQRSIPLYRRAVITRASSTRSAFAIVAAGEAPYDASLDAPVGAGTDTGLDLLADNHAASPEANMRYAESAEAALDHIRRAILTPQGNRKRNPLMLVRELELVRRRFIAADPEWLSDIGASWGVSRERTRQMETDVIAKLRAAV